MNCFIEFVGFWKMEDFKTREKCARFRINDFAHMIDD